jgi:hypothetical protein
MSFMPQLRVIPLERIRPHEEVDPLRVDRLAPRLEGEGIQLNPIIATEHESGDYVLLDGATRTESLKRLELSYAVVQIVEPDVVQLETWHHVVRQAPADEIIASVVDHDGLEVIGDEGPPRITTPDGAVRTVLGTGISYFAALAALVDAYVGQWKLSRVIDPDLDLVAWRYPDWAAVVEFPALTIEDVMKAAIDNDPLPAGITRFVVPDRALRINVELSLLREPGSALEKQELLDRIFEERARAGRIRRYEEPVVILDD